MPGKPKQTVESTPPTAWWKRWPYLSCASGVLVAGLLVWWFLVLQCDPVMPVAPAYQTDEGGAYAEELAKAAQILSFKLLLLGWLFVALGGFLALCAALVGPSQVSEPPASVMGTLKVQRGLVCSAFAILSGGLGWQLLDRSSAASQVASAANVAISVATRADDGDRRAYEACVQAKSAWLEGRMNHDRLLSITTELSGLKKQSSDKTVEDAKKDAGKDTGKETDGGQGADHDAGGSSAEEPGGPTPGAPGPPEVGDGR